MMSVRISKQMLKSTDGLLIRSAKFTFCAQAQQQILETSENAGETSNSETKDLFQSITQSETFQDLTSEANSGYAYGKTSSIEWNRDNNELWTVADSVPLSRIMNAQSVEAIRAELDRMKSQSNTRRKGQSNRIMEILDSLAESANIPPDEQDEDQSDEQCDDESAESSSTDASTETATDQRLTHAYYKAIRRCAHLKQFFEGIKLYEEAMNSKTDKLGKPRLLSALIFLKMHQDFSRKRLDECFLLMDKMHEETGHAVSASVYAELLKNANMLKVFHRGKQVVNAVLKTDDSEKLLSSKPLRQQIVSFYSKTNIAKALEFMGRIAEEYGPKQLDAVTFATMFSGMAFDIQNGNKSTMEGAEKLFEQMFKILGRAPDVAVFNAFLKCYGSMPDIDSCIDLVQMMRDKAEWPNPSVLTYGQCLKALTLYYHQPLTFAEGWKQIDTILQMMKQDGIKSHESVYGLLFMLCGGSFCGKSDLEKLYLFYDQMVADNVRLTPQSGNSLLMAGVDHYSYEIQRLPHERQRIMSELKQYTDWVFLQFQANNLKLSVEQRQKLEQRLHSM